MKRWFCLALCAALMLVGMVGAQATSPSASYSDIAGEYIFTSGAGGWYTRVVIDPQGRFTGSYVDQDYGPVRAGNGAVCEWICYTSTFSGQLDGLYPLDMLCCTARVAWLDIDGAVDDERVQDGTLYVTTMPYGITQGADLVFYMAGTPRSKLPEGLIDWMAMTREMDWWTLPENTFYSDYDDAGFVWEGPYEQSGGLWGESGAQSEGIRYPIQGVVVNCKSYATLRSEPNFDSAELDRAPLGAAVTLLSNVAYRGGNRYFVEVSYRGRYGYMCVEYLDAILPDELYGQRDYLRNCQGTVRSADAGDELLMRSGPGSGYGVTGLLWGGEVLGYQGVARLDGSGVCWYLCSHYGEDCWMAATYTVLRTDDGRTYTGKRGIYN